MSHMIIMSWCSWNNLEKLGGRSAMSVVKIHLNSDICMSEVYALVVFFIWVKNNTDDVSSY